MRPGGPIKLTLGLPLLALLLVSCKGETTPEPRSASESSGRSELPRVIEYNRDESVQYAADLPEIGCEPESKYCHNGISDRLLEEEDVFANSFLADFQGEPACSGIKIHPFGGNIVPNIAAHELASQKEDHWEFYVDFDPRSKEQLWRMTISPENTHPISGQGDAVTMARTVCSIIKGVGGTVVK